MSKKDTFKFNKYDNIGVADAVADMETLKACFVDLGTLDCLSDFSRKERILIGRTGSGKTALIQMLKERYLENAKIIEPENLSLQFLSNSTILNHLNDLGVNLDLFYKLLWKHIIAVELIRLRYKLQTEEAQKSFFRRLIELVNKDSRKVTSLNYVREWSDSFWKGTEERIKEITTNLENKIDSSLKTKYVGVRLGASSALTEEEKRVVVEVAQDIVSGIQIGKLNEVIELMSSDFSEDINRKYYLLIDKLDENWVDDKVRLQLIRALLDTVRDFSNTFKNAKVIVSIRKDLIDRVFKVTRNAGYQEEKFRSLYLHINWSSEDLAVLLNKRINYLVSRRYTSQSITYSDILPAKMTGINSFEYILERTMYRPRDIIEFFNSCIANANGKPKISQEALKDAEREYSRMRLRSLADEWHADYSTLLKSINWLQGKNTSFNISEIDKDSFEECFFHLCEPTDEYNDKLSEVVQNYFQYNTDWLIFRNQILSIYHRVGIIGLKLTPQDPTNWSYKLDSQISGAEIDNNTKAYICPMFYTILGIKYYK